MKGAVMIEFYSWPTPNGHKVHIMLEECGLEILQDRRSNLREDTKAREMLFGAQQYARR